MKIHHKLIIAFIIPTLVIGLASIAGFLWNRLLFVETAEVSAQKIRLSQMINVVKNEMSRYTLKYVNDPSPDVLKAFNDAILSQTDKIAEFSKLEMTNEERGYFAKVEMGIQQSTELEQEIINHATEIQTTTKNEKELILYVIKPELNTWSKTLPDDDKNAISKKIILTELESLLTTLISKTKYQTTYAAHALIEELKSDHKNIKSLFEQLSKYPLNQQELVWLNQLQNEVDKLINDVNDNLLLNEKIISLIQQDDILATNIDYMLDEKLFASAYNRDQTIEHTILLMNYVIVSIIASLITIGVFVSWAFARYLLRPVEYLRESIRKLRLGEQVNVKRMSNDEIGELSDAFGELVDENKEHTIKLSDQSWLKEHIAEILKTAQSEATIVGMCNTVTDKIAKLLNAGCGAFYISENHDKEQSLRLIGTYGYKRRKNISNQFKFGESLVGQAALEAKPIILSDLPTDYIQISSGLGAKQPNFIILLPICLETKVLGVMEFALFNKMTDIQQQFLEQLSDNLAVVIEAIQNRQQAETALQKVQESSEELQVQQEELRASNEELEEKTHVLQKSEEELKSQSEEMQASNEELEEKMHAIEQQKIEIQSKNNELEAIKQQLELKATDLTRAGKYKTEFLANMSHELRTPLNSLLLLSNSFAKNEDGNLTPDQIEQANVIYKGGRDLLTLINDILDLSKVEAGKLNVQIEDASIREIISDIKDQFETLVKAKNLDFIIENSVHSDTIKTDAYRLKQILRNLISNSLKFTKQGYIKLSLANTDDSHIIFKVVDTGIGIEKQKFKDIFEAFQQAYGDTDRLYGGTGLGLTISRELAKLLGGEITLESEIGKGSTFSLILPVTSQITTTSQTFTPKVVPIEPSINVIQQDNAVRNAKTILLVENNEEFTAALKEITKKKGYQCITATSVDIALELASKHCPSGIIIYLPKTETDELISKLKLDEKIKNIPIHIISKENLNNLPQDLATIKFYKLPKNDLEMTDIIDFFVTDSDVRNLPILLIDDDLVTQKAIIQAAAKRMINIIAVSSGTEGLENLRKKEFAGMILDLNLPDISGLEILDTANIEHLALPPVIVYSQKDLTPSEFAKINQFTNKIVLKEGDTSLDRLLNECSLFVHSVHKHSATKNTNVHMITEANNILLDKNILLVDDDMRNVYALSTVLKRQGMHVTIATNGEEALKKMDDMAELDMIIMDIMMPILDGFETTRRIRKKDKYKNLPIIAVTAKAMPDDKKACIEAGANDYITKPIDAEKLLSMMRVWLSSHERNVSNRG